LRRHHSRFIRPRTSSPLPPRLLTQAGSI
jgi:hypothetical protein